MGGDREHFKTILLVANGDKVAVQFLPQLMAQNFLRS